MHPGSGPSDRDNDVYFPPIRRMLLDAGCAVASFDKRGVGESSGDWLQADIVDQADDALACAAVLRRRLPAVPLGLFGHSQGGWVVLEATARSSDVAFVVTNSGPGVSPADQERYATANNLADAGWSEAQRAEGMECFERVLRAMSERVTLADFRAATQAAGQSELLARVAERAFVPEDPQLWEFAARIIDYDPGPVLSRVTVPVLALFGAADAVVPVDTSVAVFRRMVRPELLTVAVLAGGGHRIQSGSPGELVTGYREALTGFLARALPE